MKEKDNRPYVIAIVSVLIILVVILVGYIVFSVNSRDKGKVDNESTTTTSTAAVSVENNDVLKDNFDDKTSAEVITTFDINIDDNNRVYSCITEDDNVCSIQKYSQSSKYNLTYNINVGGSDVIQIKSYGKVLFIYKNGKKVAEIESVYNTLSLIQKYNNYLFIRMACLCDDYLSNRDISINLLDETVMEGYCFPEEEGKCEGIKFEKVHDRSYNEISYYVDYNINKFENIKKEEFDCIDYDYDLYEESSGCSNDEVCIRRLQFCSPLG